MPNMSLRVSDCVAAFDVGLPVEGFTDFGLSRYPIFDEEYREQLNAKIIYHYFMYEIGHETFHQFRFALARKMNEIMPYYNQLYKSTLLSIDPLSSISFKEVYDSNSVAQDKSTVDTTSKENSETDNRDQYTDGSNTVSKSASDSTSRAVSSQYPQTQLSGNADYGSSGADSVSKGSQDSNADVNSRHDGVNIAKGSTDAQALSSAVQEGSQRLDSVRELTGRQGSASALLLEYRQTFLNVDMEIIKELASLFSGIWDSNAYFTEQGGYVNGYGWPGFFGPFGF